MTPEGKIQREIRDVLDTKGLFYWRAQAFHRRGISVDKGQVGMPDFFLLHKGHLYGLEIKTPKGIPSKEQIEWGRKIQEAGGSFYIVRSAEDVLNALQYDIPTKTH